jgi:hypothetical protein
MIKFGIRNNLLYPILFVVFIGLRRIVKLVLEHEELINFKSPFLLSLLMFFSEFVIGGITAIVLNKKKRKSISKIAGIELINNNNDLNRQDSDSKIIFLMILAAIIEFIGALSRRYAFKIIDKDDDKEDNLWEQINTRLRSFEIIVSSLLSYFILHIKIYKHHLVTLIIISVFLICALIIEISIENFEIILKNFIILNISTFSRAFLDIIEKHLFDKDFVDAFKITSFEGFVDTIIISFFYIDPTPRDEIKELFELNRYKLLAFILLILYGILSVYKNIYRRYTLNEYSPMTRALAESIFDPFIIIYKYIDSTNNDGRSNDLVYFILFLILSIIMVFCSCVYNELFVLYYCDMEKDTYIEINKRSREINEGYRDLDEIEGENKGKNVNN